MARYDFREYERQEIEVRTVEFVAGAEDAVNHGQIVVMAKPTPGALQIQSATRLTVQVGILDLYPN